VAAPLLTVPEVTFVPCTVKVTVPAFTVPAVLVTVADNVTGCVLALDVAVALAEVVVVAPGLTVRLEVPVLPLKLAPAV